MSPIALAGPTVEPVTLADMKAYLRVDGDAEDDLVAALVAAGRLTVERATRLALIEQSWRVTFPRWPECRAVPLPLAPVIEVEAVRLVDPPATPVTVANDLVRLDRSGDPIRLLVDPSVADPVRGDGRIEIDLTCGFGSSASAVPEPLRLAIRSLAAGWFERRGEESTGQSAGGGLPVDVEALIAPFRRPRLV